MRTVGEPVGGVRVDHRRDTRDVMAVVGPLIPRHERGQFGDKVRYQSGPLQANVPGAGQSQCQIMSDRFHGIGVLAWQSGCPRPGHSRPNERLHGHRIGVLALFNTRNLGGLSRAP
jgi:hypothetical protein